MNRYYFPEQIDELSADLFISQIENASPGDTVVFTIVNGGEVSHCLKLAKIIREKQLNTEAHYIVASAAVPCYCAGINRYAYATTMFLFHEPFLPVYVETAVNETALKKDAETLSQYSSAIAMAIESYTGADVKIIDDYIHADGGKGVWVNAKDLLKLNIVTDILVEDEVITEVLAKLSVEKQPVSTPPTDDIKQLSERLEAVSMDINNIYKKLDLIEAELKKPKALIPPIDPEYLEKKINKAGEVKSSLLDWYDKKLNK